MRVRTRIWVMGMALAVPLLTAGGARAEGDVVLSHRVEKVETFINDDGVREERLVPTDRVYEGDELRYTISFANDTDETIEPDSIVVTNPIPAHTQYIEGSAYGAGTTVEFSVDGGDRFAAPEQLSVGGEDGPRVALPSDYTTIRWHYGSPLAPGQQGQVFFRVRTL